VNVLMKHKLAPRPRRGMAVGMAAKRAARSKTPRKKAARAAPPPPEAAPQPELQPETLPASAFSPPEVEFAARVPAALPDRARPIRRRAIFIDVENESRATRIEQALEALHVDHATAATDIVAAGNWRVISHETARLLARKGAQLMHSAPAVGVRDWSDLRIAVAAGAWLASAHPGDRLDIVSADRAFDAVGDVAATLGVDFQRHSQRTPVRAQAVRTAARPEPGAEAPKRRRRRSGRGGKDRARPVVRDVAQPAEVVPSAEAPSAEPAASGHAPASSVAAPQDEILAVVRELLQASPRGVMLDAIANRLKANGFERPPNSPRLVTRLRSMKELRVSPRGQVTLAP
jgi:hypothetical protein